MSEVNAIVDAEVASLERKEQELEAKKSEANRILYEADVELVSVRQQLGAWTVVRAKLNSSNDTHKNGILPLPFDNHGPASAKPSATIYRYIENHPGCTKKEILDTVQQLPIDTQVPPERRRKFLDALIYQGIKSEKIRREGERYYRNTGA